MKVRRAVCISILIASILAISNADSDTNVKEKECGDKKSRTDVDGVIDDLEIEDWEDYESPCLDKTLSVLQNVRNFTLWAVWIWDSVQSPAGILYGLKDHLGYYDQCLKAPWVARPEIQTQYCLADIKLSDSYPERQTDVDHTSSVEQYLKRPSKYGRDFSTITWGVCLPIECEPESISKILRILLMRSHLSPLKNSSITVASCEKAGHNVQYSTGYYVFILMISFLLITNIFSTICLSQKSDNINTYTNVLQRIAKSFDLKRNFNRLTETRDDDIHAIHAMRAITALVAVHAHQIQLSHHFGVRNGLDVEKALDSNISLLLRHIEIVINHFTIISGMLLMKSLMDREQNLVNFLIKRYIRLIGPAVIMIFYFISVSPYMGDGPLWSRLNGRETEACVKNWWLIPLMLNNYVNTKDMCQLVYWYIPADFHLAVFGTFIFFIFKKSKKIGCGLLVVVTASSTILPGLAVYWNKFPPTLIHDLERMDLRKNIFFMESYIKTHHRAGRYLIGMAMGWFMSTRKPLNYTRIINEKWSLIILTINVLFGTSIWLFGGIMTERDYDALEAAVFVASTNVLYAVSLCATFFISEYGTLPLLFNAIKLPVFVVLSRISYCIYLVHIAIIQRIVFSGRGPGEYDFFSGITAGLGVAVVAIGISFILWFLVESPLTSLASLVLSSGKHDIGEEKSKMIENAVSKQNGRQQNGDDNKKKK